MATTGVVKIGEHKTDLRMTLLSNKRIRKEFGCGLQELGRRVQGGEADPEDVMPTMIWALVSHHPELREMSEDDVSALIEVGDLEAITEAIQALFGDGPPRKARGTKKPAPRRPKR